MADHRDAGAATEALLKRTFADCPLITAQDAARLLGLDEKTLRAMADGGVIRTVIVGASTRRYTEPDIRAFLAGERFGEVNGSAGAHRSRRSPPAAEKTVIGRRRAQPKARGRQES